MINVINDWENPIKTNTPFVWNVDSKKNSKNIVSEWKFFWMFFLLLFYLPFLFIIIRSSFAIKCKLHRIFSSADQRFCNFTDRREMFVLAQALLLLIRIINSDSFPNWSIICMVILNTILTWKKNRKLPTYTFLPPFFLILSIENNFCFHPIF